jgi:peroxiredoxin Q/BCP
MLNAGDRAPEFTAKTDTGTSVSLKDFRGERIVLFFYPKDDTAGCTREACGFRDNYAAITGHGAAVLGVSADGVESHEAFKRKYSLPFTLLSDPDKTIITAYGVWKERTASDGRTFMGIERTTFIIDERGMIAKIFPKVKVDGHTEEVLAALAEPASTARS